MDIIFTKGSGKYNHLTCKRSDSSITETKLPEQGIAPHDLIHYVVEKHLPLKGALYGQIKAGADFSFTLEHNEASKQIANKVEVWQSESMVESLQSLLWSKTTHFENFHYLIEQTCSNRNIPTPAINEVMFNDLINELLDLNARWQTLKPKEALSVVYE